MFYKQSTLNHGFTEKNDLILDSVCGWVGGEIRTKRGYKTVNFVGVFSLSYSLTFSGLDFNKGRYKFILTEQAAKRIHKYRHTIVIP